MLVSVFQVKIMFFKQFIHFVTLSLLQLSSEARFSVTYSSYYETAPLPANLWHTHSL